MAIVIAAIYGRAADSPFIFDDYSSIQTNDSIVSLWPLWSSDGRPGPLNTPPSVPITARPIVNLSFALNYWFSGLDPTSYHWTNIALHIGSAIILVAIVRRTLKLPYFDGRFDATADWIAAAVGMIWAIHPLQTETVTYATQRTELMAGFFYFATLYCSLRFWAAQSDATLVGGLNQAKSIASPIHAPASGWFVLATFACLGGMGSKEVMVSAPLLVLLFERTFVAGSLYDALRRSWTLYCGLACGWLLLLWLHADAPHRESIGFDLGVSAYVWWLTQSKVLLMYLKLVVWPWPLLIHYEVPYLDSLAVSWMYLIPVALLGLTTLLLLWRNHPAGLVGTAAFAILLPTLVIPMPTEIAAERRMYLPLASIVVLVVLGGYSLVQRLSRLGRESQSQATPLWPVPLWGFAASVVIIAVVFSAVSMRRLHAYDNEFTLWQEVVRLQPHDYMGHLNSGVQLFNDGKVAQAMEYYREALRLKPDSSQVHYNLGLGFLKLNEPLQAAEAFREAVRLKPDSSRLMNNFGVALFIAGRNDEAIRVFQETLKLEPTMWRAHDNLGSAFSRATRYTEAIQCFQRALQLNPQALDVYGHLADSQAKSQQPAAAIATVEKALQLARATGASATAAKIDAQLAAYRASQARMTLETTNSAGNTPPSN